MRVSKEENLTQAGARLREIAALLDAIADRSLTQGQVADKLGITPQSLSHYLNGHIDTLIRRMPFDTSELVERLKQLRTPGDRLLMDILNITDPENTVTALPDYDEDTLWDVALSDLSPREYFIVSRAYGLMTGEPMPQPQIAQELYVTRERVRQIHTRALSKLRHPSRVKRIFSDLNVAQTDVIPYMRAVADAAHARYERAKAAYDDRHRLERAAEDYDRDIPEPEDGPDPRSIPLEDLEFSVRTYNVLTRAGVTDLGGLADMDPAKILGLRNLGRRSANEIYHVLKDRLGIEKPELKMP